MCLIAVLAVGTFQFLGIGIEPVSANNTPQTLPFSQNWTNVGLITADDNWSGVPGIVGFRGDDINTTIGADLRTILGDGSATPVDVNANRSDPDTFATGGVVEFDGIANPVIALQGSGTADVPHIVIYLNTTGFTNIQVAYNARDIDNGTGVDAAQQINTQFRVGGTGDYANVTGGYIADASNPGGATLVTPVNVTLPATANNQSLVEVRITTINAPGSDEFIGLDDISITGTSGPTAPQQHVVDFDGNGRTDFAVVRNTGVGSGGQLTWFINYNGGVGGSVAYDWGISTTDYFVPEDFDGDNKSDVAVWRDAPSGTAAFYILQSATNTVKVDIFGQSGDDPTVVGDYDGDGKADAAVYRQSASAGQQNIWFYRASSNNPNNNVTYVPWGQSGDFVAPGDYDGDGKNDFVIQRNAGGGQAAFWTLLATGVTNVKIFGTPNDIILPGDYDGDGKTDLAVSRGVAGSINWYILNSSTGAITTATWGASATDFQVQGDYDGDGKTDVAVWRPSATAGQSAFYVLGSTSGPIIAAWGQQGDFPVAGYNSH